MPNKFYFIKRTINKIKFAILSIKYANSPKIICIGKNKTGTTSMAKLLKSMGYTVAPQRPAELMFKDWSKGDFTNIIRFVRNKGTAFQDVPFSLPETYKALDESFKDSKFILTVRDTPEVWYNSLVSFHAKLFGNGKTPTKKDLIKNSYVYQGYIWDLIQALYHTPEDDIYNKTTLIKNYNDYNNSVIEYFKDKPGKLLVINLKEKDALKKIGTFLNNKKIPNEIPWENKT